MVYSLFSACARLLHFFTFSPPKVWHHDRIPVQPVAYPCIPSSKFDDCPLQGQYTHILRHHAHTLVDARQAETTCNSCTI